MKIMETIEGRYGVDIQVEGQAEPWQLCASRYGKETTIQDAKDFIGTPYAGILLAYREGEWFYCDGVNPNTGKNFTAEEVVLMLDVFGKVEILQ